MSKDRKIASIVGLLILLAYSIVATGNSNARLMGAFFEALSGASVILIAVLMYSYLKPYGKNLTFLYLTLKTVEGTLAIIAGYLFYSADPALLVIRDDIYQAHGYIFAIPALIFYFLLYKSKIVPDFLSVWGAIAAIILVIVNFLEFLNLVPKLEILYLPIVLNEAVLAIWLIAKGFNLSLDYEKINSIER